MLAVDSTKLAANASRDATHSYEQLPTRSKKRRTRSTEDDLQFGDRRGDELPRMERGLVQSQRRTVSAR